MTLEEIIAGFELYVDDLTELSTVEETTLANKIYKQISRNRPWEWLKTPAAGTLSTSIPYISLPADFAHLSENAQYSDAVSSYNTPTRTVLIGTDYRPYQIVNFSDRRQYRGIDGYAYLDIGNSRLVFTKQPTVADSYEFDYIKIPSALTTGTSPLFPADFHPMIYHGMAIDDDIIQRFDKARSYKDENQAKFDNYMRDLAYWNAQLQQN